MEANKISAKLQWEKAQLPEIWQGYVRFKRKWTKILSVLTLPVELKEQKCAIGWFKLCSSKLTIISSTWSDLSFISKGTLSCSSPERLVFTTGRKEIERTRCGMLGNPNLQVTENCDSATSTDYASFYSSYHWCWKLKNYCETINIAIVRKTMGVGTGGAGVDQGTPWILKISAKKVVFLVSRGKKQISQLASLEKFEKTPWWPPWKNFFRRPCV